MSLYTSTHFKYISEGIFYSVVLQLLLKAVVGKFFLALLGQDSIIVQIKQAV